MYYDFGAYDMRYEEFKEMCHKAWIERFNYLCIDMTKNKMKLRIVFAMKTKPHILKVSPIVNLFKSIWLLFTQVFFYV